MALELSFGSRETLYRGFVVLLGMRSSVGGLLRRITALGVLFGVLVAPAEMSIPDLHDGTTIQVATIQAAPTQAAEQDGAIGHDVAVLSDNSVDPGSHSHSQQGQQGTSNSGSHGGYDHCTHSHVTCAVHSEASAGVGGIVHILYNTISECPDSFATAPHVRPPIA